jgi:hypothetical protein
MSADVKHFALELVLRKRRQEARQTVRALDFLPQLAALAGGQTPS